PNAFRSQPLQVGDVPDRLCRRDLGLVALVEGADVALRQGSAAYVPMQLDEPTTQLLTPASRQLRDGALELLDVDGAYVHRRREVEVEAGVLLVLGQRQTVVAGIGPQPSLEE